MDGEYAVIFDEYANIEKSGLFFDVKNGDKRYLGGFGELIPK